MQRAGLVIIMDARLTRSLVDTFYHMYDPGHFLYLFIFVFVYCYCIDCGGSVFNLVHIKRTKTPFLWVHNTTRIKLAQVGQDSFLVRPSDNSPGNYSLFFLCNGYQPILTDEINYLRKLQHA